MLSVFDLLDAKTLDIELAAYLMARISRGASFLVGAIPGGAGKTTVMCALLNFVPADIELIAAASNAVTSAETAEQAGGKCYVCHEIGSGYYFAYLWDADLRRYCRLVDKGHMLATNLHADTLQQAHAQICGENGVPAEHFNRFELALFLTVEGGLFDACRQIGTVHSSDGRQPHELVYDRAAAVSRLSPTAAADEDYITACRTFLETAWSQGIRTIQQTRQAVLEFFAGNQHPESL